MTGSGRDELEGKLRVAFRILGDYAAVLERHESGGVLIPESELPAERDAIKACILLAAAYRIANGGQQREVVAQARISYATLSHFVPDALAAREAAFGASTETALAHAARNDAPPEAVAASIADAPVAEMAAARAAYASLEAEFDRSFSRILAEFGG